MILSNAKYEVAKNAFSYRLNEHLKTFADSLQTLHATLLTTNLSNNQPTQQETFARRSRAPLIPSGARFPPAIRNSFYLNINDVRIPAA